jgi:hypothetical protein
MYHGTAAESSKIFRADHLSVDKPLYFRRFPGRLVSQFVVLELPVSHYYIHFNGALQGRFKGSL